MSPTRARRIATLLQQLAEEYAAEAEGAPPEPPKPRKPTTADKLKLYPPTDIDRQRAERFARQRGLPRPEVRSPDGKR